MSAYLDRSQGITFVYSNIFELYKKAKESKLDAPFLAEPGVGEPAKSDIEEHASRSPAEPHRVLKNLNAKESSVEGKQAPKVEEFEPKELKTPDNERPFPVPMGVREAEEKAKRLNMRPVANLQKNLSELADAHDKLRFLLQELEELTKKKG